METRATHNGTDADLHWNLAEAGSAGWVVLFDEVELIGRDSLLQRGRSYAELARWLDGDPDDVGEPLVVVAAITDDFETAVLSGKNDRESLPGRLRDKQTDEYAEMAAFAETGTRHIERDLLSLVPPGEAELDRAYSTLRRLHGSAFGWEPPDVAGLEQLGLNRCHRRYVSQVSGAAVSLRGPRIVDYRETPCTRLDPLEFYLPQPPSPWRPSP